MFSKTSGIGFGTTLALAREKEILEAERQRKRRLSTIVQQQRKMSNTSQGANSVNIQILQLIICLYEMILDFTTSIHIRSDVGLGDAQGEEAG